MKPRPSAPCATPACSSSGSEYASRRAAIAVIAALHLRERCHSMAAIVNYFEIGSAQPEAAQKFYSSMFDWSFGETSPAAYQAVNGDQGGLWDTSSMGGASWAIFYVQVDDVHAAIDR